MVCSKYDACGLQHDRQENQPGTQPVNRKSLSQYNDEALFVYVC